MSTSAGSLQDESMINMQYTHLWLDSGTKQTIVSNDWGSTNWVLSQRKEKC